MPQPDDLGLPPAGDVRGKRSACPTGGDCRLKSEQCGGEVACRGNVAGGVVRRSPSAQSPRGMHGQFIQFIQLILPRSCQGPWGADLEVLMAVGRKRRLSAFPPDHPLWSHPTLTRLGLVQHWAVLQIPYWDQLRPEAGISMRFLGGHPNCARLVHSRLRRGC